MYLWTTINWEDKSYYLSIDAKPSYLNSSDRVVWEDLFCHFLHQALSDRHGNKPHTTEWSRAYGDEHHDTLMKVVMVGILLLKFHHHHRKCHILRPFKFHHQLPKSWREIHCPLLVYCGIPQVRYSTRTAAGRFHTSSSSLWPPPQRTPWWGAPTSGMPGSSSRDSGVETAWRDSLPATDHPFAVLGTSYVLACRLLIVLWDTPPLPSRQCCVIQDPFVWSSSNLWIAAQTHEFWLWPHPLMEHLWHQLLSVHVYSIMANYTCYYCKL